MHRPDRLPPYVQAFADRHGRPRYYFRRRGYPSAPLPGLPWSPEFMAAHAAALTGGAADVGARRTLPGTLDALAVSYYRSADFLNLRPISQATNRNVIERIRAEHGDKPIARLERKNVQRMLAKLADRPGAANRWLKALRVLLRHALEIGMVKHNAAAGIRTRRAKPGGHATWTEENIAAFKAAHAPGTRERLAFELLLCTGQRRGDVVRMGRQHVRDGVLAIRQSKTGTAVEIPILPELRKALDVLPADRLTFLATARGEPFTAAGFGNYFRDAVSAAGLPVGLSAHGLRKAACRRLAEYGCTAHEIMAVSGHLSLSEAQKYCAMANRARLARDAMAKVTRFDRRTERRTKTVKPPPKV